MFKVTMADEATQAALGQGKATAVDLTPYKAPIQSLQTHMVGNGYSKWARVEVDKPEDRKATQRRFSQAAKALGVHVGYHKDEKMPKVLHFRLRPAPKPRPGAKKAPAAAAS